MSSQSVDLVLSLTKGELELVLTRARISSQVISDMKRNGLAWSKMAKKLKVSRGVLHKIIDGDYDFTLSELNSICEILGFYPSVYISPLPS